MALILVVDDDVNVALLLRYVLLQEGYGAEVAHDARSAVDVLRRNPPDLIVLDPVLPDARDGEVIQRIREQSPVPILVLSDDRTEETIIGLLKAEVDAYVTKPFSPPQLLARIKAVLRRTSHDSPTEAGPERLAAGPVVLDLGTREVLCNDRHVGLTPTEFLLLQHLLANSGRVLTFDELVRRVWGIDGAGNEGLVRIHVSRLRRKLAPALGDRKVVVSHPRIGYRFAAQ